MPLDSHLYLTSRGWKGKGTALRDGGLERPVVQAQKKDLKGIGQNRDDGFQFWDHVYAAAAQAIEIKVHGDDGDEESDQQCDDTASNSTGAGQAATDSQELGRHGKRDRQVLELTRTGILSNRRPGTSQRRVVEDNLIPDCGTSSAVTEGGSKGDLLAMAKREAARRELYRRFYRGEIISEQSEQAEATDSGTGQGDGSSSADSRAQRKAERRQRREERRALKQQAKDQKTKKRRKVV